MSFREPNGAVMTANMNLLGWGRSIRASSLRGLQSRSATGQNGQAAKEKMSWRAGCSENISGFRLREKCFLLDIPFYRTSGTSVQKRPRISRGGSRHLRRALYMPALVALRREPHLRAFYQRLLSRGKARLQAVVAVMRKLLHALFAMFRSNQSFDGSKLCPIELTTKLAA